MNEVSGTYATNSGDSEAKNTALIDGVRRFALSVTELDMDLIDRINPFGEAYAILAKSMSEERLRQVAAVIAAKRINLSVEEARDLTKRALRFKQEKGLLQKFFGSARLDVELKDRFGTPVKPREWFLVQLKVIEEVIEKIKEGTIDQFRYDRETASLTRL